MPWNKATQEEYKRNGKELETTLTDDEWKLIEPLLPAPVPKGPSPNNRSPSSVQRDPIHYKDGLFGSVRDANGASYLVAFLPSLP